ncbi:MAG: ferric reductase-like transmembrane domain-containing protein [Dehalococcoidia bacterium]
MTHEFWYLSRAAGFTAYLLLFASVALGIAVSTRAGKRLAGQNALFDIHRFLSILALAFSLFHVYVLLGDGYLNYNAWQLTLPFLSPYRLLAVAVGSFAMYSLVLIVVSFYLRQFIGYRAWRTLHFLTFAMYAAVTLHGITAGTDTTQPWARAIYVVTGAIVLGLLAYRLQYHIPASATMQRIRLASGGLAIVTAIGLTFGTGLLSAKKALPQSAAAAATSAATQPYPFLPTFQESISGTYTQTGDANASHLVMQGTTRGNLSAELRIELASQGSATVTVNKAELIDPASNAVICEGKLTTFGEDGARMTCQGAGPYAGVSMAMLARFSAAAGGSFSGALSGVMSRSG